MRPGAAFAPPAAGDTTRHGRDATERGPCAAAGTTGACAAAAAKAAYHGARTGSFPDPVAIPLPGGSRPAFALAVSERLPDGARAGIVKDAGDDPDVTHGALVIATVRPGPPGSGCTFAPGRGSES